MSYFIFYLRFLSQSSSFFSLNLSCFEVSHTQHATFFTQTIILHIGRLVANTWSWFHCAPNSISFGRKSNLKENRVNIDSGSTEIMVQIRTSKLYENYDTPNIKISLDLNISLYQFYMQRHINIFVSQSAHCP